MNNKGFTLVEIAIVLILLGLLIGGILAGRSLIRAAEIKEITSDIVKYQVAVQNFQSQYEALPGDMQNATALWGVAAGTGSDITCQNTSSERVTCNGNGDKWIGKDSATQYEWFRAFQHLVNAGMIKGSYTGIGRNAPSASQGGCITGENCPLMAVSNVTIQIRTEGAMTDVNDINYYVHRKGNLLLLGSNNVAGGANNNPDGAALLPEEAFNIDSKLDDGKPGTGSMISAAKKGATDPWAQDTKDCADNTNYLTANYDLSRDTLSCALRIFF